MFTTSFRSIIALLLLSSLPVVADEGSSDGKWKLNPLAYNNPGLKVDLGVGLWAWPLPMDYDGDGDMDLLVACFRVLLNKCSHAFLFSARRSGNVGASFL